MKYTADFETTTDLNDCRVWAWAVCEIGEEFGFQYGNSIETFIEFLRKSKNSTFYFHNLKFDMEFLINYLFTHSYKHVTKREEETSNTFTTLISDKGQVYSVKIIFEKKGKKTNSVTIYDSLKILPFSVSQISKSFKLPMSKLKLDYKAYREIGHILTIDEIAYIKNDVTIVAKALDILFQQGMTKMTQGSNALNNYKTMTGKKRFEQLFPIPEYEIDKDIRQSYKGGFTYLNPKYKDVDIGEGLVFDFNSLYPSVLHDCLLPYGEPLYFEGEYKEDKLYNLYVQMFTCQFELKENHIPTIQLKNNLNFVPTQYLENSGTEEVTMCLTSVDLELFKEHYHIYNPVWHNGWKFKSTNTLFKDYVDRWTAEKIKAKKEKNWGMYVLSKLMLNALYGKFSLNPNVCSNIPYMDNGIVKYRKGEKEVRNPIYIPVGTFTTAWARYRTITFAQKIYDKFVYADTDSLHINVKLPESLRKLSNDELEEMTTEDLRNHGLDLPEDFEINPYDLGKLKLESRFTRARFLRQKCYIEDWNKPDTWEKEKFDSKEVKEYCEENEIDFNEEIKKYNGMYDKQLLNITCAGMPEQCYKEVSWENFKIGNSFYGKLQTKHVKGGIVLIDGYHTLRP